MENFCDELQVRAELLSDNNCIKCCVNIDVAVIIFYMILIPIL